jgi:large subunit ribosomal protein L6
MSRIGKKPISIPKGVTVTVKGDAVEVKGPAGTLVRKFRPELSVEVKEGNVIVSPKDTTSPLTPALFGLTRTLIANMVQGVVTPWKKDLEIQGVGYRATKSGQMLNLALGFSHPVDFKIPDTVQFTVDAKQTQISMSCPDKELLGTIAARIRSIRPPEPYKGKGVRYAGEHILRKAGKAAGGAGAGAGAGGKK